MSDLWLVYRRRSNKRLGTAKVARSADVSDQTQLDKCLAVLPPGVRYETIDDLGGKQSGRTDKREGWREVVRRVSGGGIAGVVAYDVSRLARKTKLILDLREEMVRHRTQLRIATIPDMDWDSAAGEIVLTTLASSSTLLARMDSERMRDMMRSTFEEGGHRGNDPFGYRTIRDAKGEVAKPRMLEIVPEEAEVIRRVFALLRDHSFIAAASVLNAEGTRHRNPRPWTQARVKDIFRRRDFYRPVEGDPEHGHVTTNRGLDPHPGKHAPILTEAEYADALAGVGSRKAYKSPKPVRAHRTYILRGLVYCECGQRMAGDTRISRGKEWAYFYCPNADGKRPMRDADGNLITCNARRVPALAAERFVLEAITAFQIPPEAAASMSEELRRALASPAAGSTEKERARLRTHIERLRKQHAWGDISDADYRRERADIESKIAAIPTDDDKVVIFDRHRQVIQSLGDEMAQMTRERLAEVAALLVERVETRDRRVVKVVWSGAARPFFTGATVDADDESAVWSWRPRTDSNRRRQP